MVVVTMRPIAEEAFQAGFGPHTREIIADIPNYTYQAPIIQISEVVVGEPWILVSGA